MLRSHVSVVDKSLQQFEGLSGVLDNVMQNATTVAEDLQECGEKYGAHVRAVEKHVIDFAQLSCNVDYLKDSIKEVESVINTHDGETDPPDLVKAFETKLLALQGSGATFDPSGHPAVVEFHRRLRTAGADESEEEDTQTQTQGEDEDGELVVGQVQVSLVCPLTKKLLENPMTSTKCNHSYSKAAIMEHIKKRSNSKCPVCNIALSVQDLTKDSKLEREVRKERKKKGSKPSSTHSDVVKL